MMKTRWIMAVAGGVGLMMVSGALAGGSAEEVAPIAAPAAAPVKVAAPAPVAAPAAVAAPVAAPACAAKCEQAKKDSLRYGGDERVRQEFFENMPAGGPPGKNDYYRFRTRLWSEYDVLDNVTIRARIVNEARAWNHPDVSARPQSATYEFPDEWVLDNLYVEVRGLMDNSVDVRVGRQDLMYGNGRVILEGTPEDGSRTIYFNAVKATVKSLPNTTVDVLAIYNPNEDELAINPADRDLTGLTGAYDGMEESGGGFYLKNQSMKDMPLEVYGLYKNESAWKQAAVKNPKKPGQFVDPAYPAWQTLDAKSGKVENDEADIYTLGFRLMPKLNDMWSGNLEVAGQTGTRGDADLQAYMVDAYASCKLPVLKDMAPVANAGVYILSGDDPKTKDDEGWNPLWARYPQDSELYVYAYPRGRWSNLTMPNAKITMAPAKWVKTTAMLGYLMADENDGPGPGTERGWLGTVKGEFTIAEKMLTKTDKLTGHLLAEVLEPGDYYLSERTTCFLRWEVMYAF